MKYKLIIAGLTAAILAAIGNAQTGGNAKAGRVKAAASCAQCHGADGKGIAPNPPLTGSKESYIAEQLRSYKSGVRTNPIMNSIANPLTEQDIANLAAHYASLK